MMTSVDESFSKDVEAATEDGSLDGYVPASTTTEIPGIARKRDRKITALLIVVAVVVAGLVAGLAIYMTNRADSAASVSSLSSALNFTDDDINGGSGGGGGGHHGHHGGHKKPKYGRGNRSRTYCKNETKFGNHSYVHNESDFFN
jgi:hypothetical protein